MDSSLNFQGIQFSAKPWLMYGLSICFIYVPLGSHWDQTNWRWKAESNLTKWFGVKMGPQNVQKVCQSFPH